MMEFYKLRIDLEKVSLEKVLEYINVHSNGISAWCVEGGEVNPHVHCYFGSTVKQATMRKHLRELGLSGNGGYSLKSCEENPTAYFAYMMKEKRFNFSNLPTEWVRLATEHNETVVAGIAKKKAERKSVLQQIIDKLPEYETTMDRGKKVPTTLAIEDCILDFHRDNGILVRKFQLIAYRDTIMLKYSDNSDMRHMFS